MVLFFMVKYTGVKSLDEVALSAVKKVDRFPTIPAGIRKQLLSYVTPLLTV